MQRKKKVLNVAVGVLAVVTLVYLGIVLFKFIN